MSEMTELDYFELEKAVNTVVAYCYKMAETGGWWNGVDKDNVYLQATKLGLIAGEAHEAIEALRKDSQDDHLPQYKGVDTELADVFIRTADYSGAFEINLGRVLVDKLKYNASRKDHKPENRQKKGGKRF